MASDNPAHQRALPAAGVCVEMSPDALSSEVGLWERTGPLHGAVTLGHGREELISLPSSSSSLLPVRLDSSAIQVLCVNSQPWTEPLSYEPE